MRSVQIESSRFATTHTHRDLANGDKPSLIERSPSHHSSREQVRQARSDPLLLSSTKTIQDMRNPSPSGVKPSLPWNYSLGQFYTIGYPTNLYTDKCQAVGDFWGHVDIGFGNRSNTWSEAPGPAFWSTYRVPMLCGAGDCQDCISEGGCIDGTLLDCAFKLTSLPIMTCAHHDMRPPLARAVLLQGTDHEHIIRHWRRLPMHR